MHSFALWLAHTRASLAIQTHDWIIPTIQSIHIVAIGIVFVSVLMIDLRLFGWAGRDQSLTQTTHRFASWLWRALIVLFFTGAAMVIGEPVRELLSLAFWMKMSLLVVGITLAVLFQTALRRNEHRLENSLTTKGLAILMLLVWCSIIILGRLIAYDTIWGSWSLNPRI